MAKRTGRKKLGPRHLAVLRELATAGPRTRAQLTAGRLRHVARAKRKQVMNELTRAALVEVEGRKPARGQVALYYRITPVGLAVTQDTA